MKNYFHKLRESVASEEYYKVYFDQFGKSADLEKYSCFDDFRKDLLIEFDLINNKFLGEWEMTLQELQSVITELRHESSKKTDSFDEYYAISACVDAFVCYRYILSKKGEW